MSKFEEWYKENTPDINMIMTSNKQILNIVWNAAIDEAVEVAKDLDMNETVFPKKEEKEWLIETIKELKQ